jgi:Domain of unknown function (DUF4917)
MPILTFAEAIEEAQRYNKRHLLLGNGFSIACRPDIFAYGRLYEQANFSQISTTAKLAFDALKTQDFERVIKALRDAAAILRAYDSPSSFTDHLSEDADGLRELLVQTIAASHPAWPGEIEDAEYTACNHLKCIRKGKISHLYVGLFGDPNSESNKFIVRRANQLSNARRGKVALAVTYYDAKSARVWGR